MAYSVDFLKALAVVMKEECLGGDCTNCYTNNPLDPGGPTCCGVTQREYDLWRARHSLPTRPVAQLGIDDERLEIYWEDYWLVAKCDQLSWPLSLVHFDAAVNASPREATELLQGALHLSADGIFGPITSHAAQAADPVVTADRHLLLRAFYYLHLAAKHPAFERGWLLRVESVYNEVHK